MLKSMTAYGRAEKKVKGLQLAVEIKSLNSKGMDLSLRIPPSCRDKEQELRAKLTEILERGKIDASVSIEEAGISQKFSLNKPLVQAYYKELRELSASLQAKQENLLDLALRMPDAITAKKKQEDVPWNILFNVCSKLLARQIAFVSKKGQSWKENSKKVLHKYSNCFIK
jgi:Uncharacterized stress-induced protein